MHTVAMIKCARIINTPSSHVLSNIAKCHNYKDNRFHAIVSCYECGGFFCENCLRVHKQLPSTKNYSMLSLNQPMPLIVAENKLFFCQKHPQELLKLYCEDCNSMVCQDCTLVKHRTHNYSFVDEIIKEEKKCLQVASKELKQILASTTEAIIGVEQILVKILSYSDQCVTELNKTLNFQEIEDMSSNRRSVFLNEVLQVTNDDLCPLQKQQENIMTL